MKKRPGKHTEAEANLDLRLSYTKFKEQVWQRAQAGEGMDEARGLWHPISDLFEMADFAISRLNHLAKTRPDLISEPASKRLTWPSYVGLSADFEASSAMLRDIGFGESCGLEIKRQTKGGVLLSIAMSELKEIRGDVLMDWRSRIAYGNAIGSLPKISRDGFNKWAGLIRKSLTLKHGPISLREECIPEEWKDNLALMARLGLAYRWIQRRVDQRKINFEEANLLQIEISNSPAFKFETGSDAATLLRTSSPEVRRVTNGREKPLGAANFKSLIRSEEGKWQLLLSDLLRRMKSLLPK